MQIMSPEEFSQGKKRNHATTAAIVDLVLAVAVGGEAINIAARTFGNGYDDQPAVIITVSFAIAAALLLLAAILLLAWRVPWAAHLGELGVGIPVLLFDGFVIYALTTCEELGCLGAQFGLLIAVIVTLVGVVAWTLNHNAHRRLSVGHP